MLISVSVFMDLEARDLLIKLNKESGIAKIKIKTEINILDKCLVDVENSCWRPKKQNALTVCEEHVCPSVYGITGVSEVIDESLNWLLITQTYLFIYNKNSTIQMFWIGKIVKMILKFLMLTKAAFIWSKIK